MFISITYAYKIGLIRLIGRVKAIAATFKSTKEIQKITIFFQFGLYIILYTFKILLLVILLAYLVLIRIARLIKYLLHSMFTASPLSEQLFMRAKTLVFQIYFCKYLSLI